MNAKLVYVPFFVLISRCFGSINQVSINQEKLNAQLIKAAQEGSAERITNLLREGADANATGDYGSRALIWAAKSGSSDCVKALVEAGVDVNVHDTWNKTAVHWAVINGHSTCLPSLIRANANVNARDKTNRMAIHEASERGYSDCLKLLIAAKADINAGGGQFRSTALHWAALDGHLNCLQVLLKAQADVMIRNDIQRTVLDEAVFNDHTDCVKMLIKHSYLLVPPAEEVLDARKRVLSVLFCFAWLRKRFPHLDNLKSESLHHKILSLNNGLQEDLVLIFLDELKKGREIKGVVLVRSKEAVVRYLIERLKKIISVMPLLQMKPSMRNLMRADHVTETFESLIREGLDERCAQLKVKKGL